MPAPMKAAKSATFTALRAAADSRSETQDCSVIALAAACGVTYDQAHKALADNGRRNGKGANLLQIGGALKALGFKRKELVSADFIKHYPGVHATALKNVTTHHPDRFPGAWKDGKTYLMITTGHILAVVDGENCDWTRGRALRATGIWEVIPA